MVGIYSDDFVEYLRSKLGYAKPTPSNIIVPCPWCEYPEEKSHYHLYISLEAPIFHCFLSNCEKSGTLSKLLRKIEGKDLSKKFYDEDKIKREDSFKAQKRIRTRKLILPKLNKDKFPHKWYYLQKRFKFHNIGLNEIPGLIFDPIEFFRINGLRFEKVNFLQYLQTNFVGFLTERHSSIIFRNVLDGQTISYYKYKMFDLPVLDYYKIPGKKKYSGKVIVAEGIFDIFGEYLFDYIGKRDETLLYASCLSSKYDNLLLSLAFYEKVYQLDLIILSDSNIPLRYYRGLKKRLSHLLKSVTIYYNKVSKDFGSAQVIPVKYVI